MASILSLTHVPRDVFLQIAGYFGPEEKRNAALVCKLFKSVFEDPKVLCKDFYEARDQLSVRQLSILFETAENIERYPVFTALIDKLKRERLYPEISEKKLHAILEESKPRYNDIDKWDCYLNTLIISERCFRKLKDFRQDKAVKIFLEHIKSTNNFMSYMKIRAPYVAAAEHSCILLRALAQADISMNETHNNNRESVLSHSLDSKKGDTPEELECVKTLIELKADYTALDYRVLYRAFSLEKENILRYLHSINVNLNHRFSDVNYLTGALFINIYSNSPSLSFIKVLVELGVDVLSTDRGKTAAEVARSLSYTEIADYLDEEIERLKKL